VHTKPAIVRVGATTTLAGLALLVALALSACRNALPPALYGPAATPAPPNYSRPVGNQFLGMRSDLRMPVLYPGDELVGGPMPIVGERIGQELADVLADACGINCPPDAQVARTAIEALIRSADARTSPTIPWGPCLDGCSSSRILKYARAVSLEVTCTGTTCDAVLRGEGRVLATYSPRSSQELEVWDQKVIFPNHVLITETGWNYGLDQVAKHPVKTTPRSGPHWQ
jgi:hypothetical protein